MELVEGIRTRKSVRAFKSTPVSREIMSKVLEIASKSPSYTNTQPWEVVLVSGEKKDELSKILLKMAEADVTANPDLPLPRAWPPELERRAREHGARRLRALGVEREDAEQRKALRLLNFKFYGAPCVLFLLMDRTLTPWSLFDIGLFAQSLILAAHSFGLGTCLQASLVNYPDAVRDLLGIPKTKQVVLGISLGYPDLAAPINSYQSSRVSLDDFVSWYS